MADPPKYEPHLHIVLHQPEIPHNTGSVGRTCVAAGAKLWLVRPLGFRLDDYYLRRAGLDYWEHLEWEVVDDWAALVERLPARPPWCFTKTATASYLDVSFAEGDVLVFGNESQGLPPSMLAENRERLLRIPIRPEARSLNLSNSVAIATFEVLRQLGAAR
jgi:tRNA (cytidine/uridine-2'-O-)-methyltransferase